MVLYRCTMIRQRWYIIHHDAPYIQIVINL